MSPEEARNQIVSMTGVSRETMARLDRMTDLLTRWTARINLVSKASLEDVWPRHILDSAQLWRLRPTGGLRWVDLGSGAGFPGLVIAVIAQEMAPALQVQLVEGDLRKAAYLEAAARETGTPVRIIPSRVESLAPLEADILSARAMAPLPDLLTIAEKHLRKTGICLFPKGRSVHKELAEARARWCFDSIEHRSLTDPTATILEIGAIHRV